MAIVISTLTGKNVTPEMTKSFAEDNGEYVQGQGTSHSFIGNAAAHWGLTCERVGKDRMDDVVQALKEGKMVVEICEAYTITGGAQFKSSIKIAGPKKEVDAKRIMGVMSMGVKQGDTVRLTIEGADEEAAAAALEQFLKDNL